MRIEILLLVAGCVLIVWFLCKNFDQENYEPQTMGSRRYWGFGRENGYSIDDHHQKQSWCYQASKLEYAPCLAGYSKYWDWSTGQPVCCVNYANY